MSTEENEAKIPILANRCCISEKGILYVAQYFGDWGYCSPVTGVFGYHCQTRRTKSKSLLVVDNIILNLTSEI
jgi:hypothetical protein